MNGRPALSASLSAQLGALRIAVELDTTAGTLALVGPNGAGKTTILSLLLGIVPKARGRIEVSGAVLLDTDLGIDVPVERRRLGYVPQDYALFPHLSVRDNIAFAVRSAYAAASGNDARVEETLRDFGLLALAARRPGTLSGGEKQRVALARALSTKPRALLLDEPLAALDAPARREVRSFLQSTLEKLGVPTLIVTHDPDDARALAQRIAIVEAGRVTQVGTWEDLVREPASPFVREFVQGKSA